MDNWKKILVLDKATIFDALGCIDRGGIGAALVINQDNILLGIVTDGDIRRALLKNSSLEQRVSLIMNTSYKYARGGEAREHLLALMQNFSIRHLPILNAENQIMGLETLDNLIRPKKIDNTVILMAGGLGARLRPLTENCPKPLLKIENKPLLEITMERFIELGFHQFIFTINYRGEMIKDYFGNGCRWGVSIDYLEETNPLGTAGSLGLIKEKIKEPLLLMNGDIITRINFFHLLKFHCLENSSLTITVRQYKQTIPYGVVNVEKNKLLSLEEKPSHYFYVNGGIYVLNPEVINEIKPNKHLDMPDLINHLLQKNKKISSFMIHEYWNDIGRIEDFNQANNDYQEQFLNSKFPTKLMV